MSDLKLGIVFDVKNGKFKSDVKQSDQVIQKFGHSTVRTAGQARQLGSALDHTNTKLAATNKVALAVTRAVGGLAAGFGAGFLLKELSDTTKNFQVLRATLETATGSKNKAADAFERLQKFAAKTPYSVEESIQAFIKLKNLGLNPSEAALNSYGNTASAMGKSLDQFIEAVADASVAEFERLKEFGIKAKNQGDKIAFTFRKNTVEVANNAAAIEKYLQDLGNNQFSGAMDRIAATYAGSLSNMGDAWDQFLLKISDDGAGDIMQNSIKGVTTSLQFLTENTEGVITVLQGGFVVAAGHAANAMIKKTTATTQSLIASRASAIATKKQAIAENKLALAYKASAVGSVQNSIADKRLIASKTALTAATKKANVAVRAGSNSMALLGGPVGIAMLAAYAIYEFASSADNASSKAERLAFDVKKLSDTYKDLTANALKEKILDTNEAIQAQSTLVTEQRKRLKQLQSSTKEVWDSNLHQKMTVANDLSKDQKAELIRLVASEERETTKLNAELALQLKLQNQLRKLSDTKDTSSILNTEVPVKKSSTKDAPIDKKLASELAKIEASLLSKEDAIKASYVRRQLIVDNALLGKVGQEKKYNNLSLALEAQKDAQLKTLAEQKAAEQTRLAEAKIQAELNARERLDQIRRDGYAAEIAELNGFHLLKMEIKAGQTQEEIEQIRNRNLMLLQEERDHLDQKRNIQLQHTGEYGQMVNKFVVMDRATGADRVGIAADIGSQMTAQMAQHSKKAFALNQAFNIAKAMMSTYTAATVALAELGPIAGPIAAGAITVMGLANVATIARQKPAGMAHDGIDEIPREGTWLLDKGERVVDSRTNQDLKQALKGGGMGGANITVNLIEDSQRAGKVEQSKGLNGEDVIRIFVADIRQGGDSADAMELTYGVQRAGT